MKEKKAVASITVREFYAQFPDDETCLQHLFEKRFGQGHVCPKCAKESRWSRLKAERAYSCQWCGHHIHPTVGTPFEDTRTPLQLWFYAIYLFTTSRHGVSGKELQRQLGVTYKTAWRMGHKIRKHMGSIKSTHIHVSKQHLQKYAKEFEFRFNRREKPSAMFPSLVSTFVKP